MFLCFQSDATSGWNAFEVSASSDCTGFLAQPSSGFLDLSGLDALFKTYFAFDPEFFVFIVTSNLLVFVSGHVLGRVVRGLTRS